MDDHASRPRDPCRYPANTQACNFLRAETFMADPRSFKKRWRFSLRASFVLLTLLAMLTAHYTNRYRHMRHAVDVLEKNDVIFQSADPSDLPWYDQLPWLAPPPRIESVMIWPNKDLETIVPVLDKLGTVKRLHYYDLTLKELEMLSQIDSIEIIHTSYGLTAEDIRPFMSHKLRDVSVDGADYNIPEDALELLFSIPTLESVGTAHGASAVPEALKAKRPGVSIYMTDFPP
jgi:hypothetical protein